MSSPLQRTAFVTSRLLEHFSISELSMQLGYPPEWWPLAATKEAVDNGLDICEASGIWPQIAVVVDRDSLTIRDNGPGISADVIRHACDFSVRVSSNSKYVSPTRGRLGNGLMAILGAAFLVGDGHGRVEIASHGTRHRLSITVDPLAQVPVITDRPIRVPRRPGTSVRIHWPSEASFQQTTGGLDSYHDLLRDLLGTFAAINPHASFSLVTPAGSFVWAARQLNLQKWSPRDATSAHWYTPEQFADLIAAQIVADRETGVTRSVRDFVGDFRGLRSTVTRKRILGPLGLTGRPLADLVVNGDLDRPLIGRLLQAMQAGSGPVPARKLGRLGEEQVRHVLETEMFVGPRSIQYRCVTGTVPDTSLPFVLEVGFGVNREGEGARVITCGVNWSAGLAPERLFPEVPRLLASVNVQPDDPVALLVHVAVPSPAFTDRGKSQLGLSLGTHLRTAVTAVTKAWTTSKRDRQRASAAAIRRQIQRPPKALSVKDGCYRVMVEAYMFASSDGRYRVGARQLMYSARKLVLGLIGEFYAPGSQTFQQNTWPAFQADYPDLTRDWRVDYDDRGTLIEPHTGRVVGLGTLAVEGYLAGWTDRPTIPTLINADALLATLRGGSGAATHGPRSRYGAILFIEKEGFMGLLQEERLAERYDLALTTTKGQSVVACREIVDAASALGIPTFCLHDFDRAGLLILRSLRETTRRYTYAAPPNVVDLGLRWEDVGRFDLDASSEPVDYSKKGGNPTPALVQAGATADEIGFLVQGRAEGGGWHGRRIELNALSSEQFLTLIEEKLVAHGVKKVVPDEDVLADLFIRQRRRRLLHARLARVVSDATDRVNAEEIGIPDGLRARVRSAIEGSDQPWEQVVAEIENDDADDAKER